jgi:phage terminase small subunit
MALTAKQRLFVDEYIKCRNATKAAIVAGYSEKTAYSIGWENLRKPEISNEIERRFEASAMSAAEVLMLLGDQARADMGPYLNEVGGLDFTKLKEDGKTHLIKKYKVIRLPSGKLKYEIETYDAQAALLAIGKVHNLFKDRVEHTGKDGGEIMLRVVYGADDGTDDPAT